MITKEMNAALDEFEQLFGTTVKNLLEEIVGRTWAGTASELLFLLQKRYNDLTKAQKWPRSPSTFSRKLRLAAQALVALGIAVTFSRTNRRRLVRLELVAKELVTVTIETKKHHQINTSDEAQHNIVTVGDGNEINFKSLFEKNSLASEVYRRRIGALARQALLKGNT